MIQYIYFVKCPNCEDEHFDFFDEAKEFALGCLGDQPIITQVEVNRNDFGECVDSCDLGTIWSWEDVMKDVSAEPELSTFTKYDLVDHGDFDPEFDSLDNSLDSVPDNFRKPVPADMTIEALVEEMEENEDTVECKWCNELFDKSEVRKEIDLGYLCPQCGAAIKSRGETLTFVEELLDEAADTTDQIEFECKRCGSYLLKKPENSRELDVGYLCPDCVEEVKALSGKVILYYEDFETTVAGNQTDADAWDETDYTGSYEYELSKTDVATDIWNEFLTEEDVKDYPGGLEALEEPLAWEKYLVTHFDALFDKYYDKLLDYYRDDAYEAWLEVVPSWSDLEYEAAAEAADYYYDEWRDSAFDY